MITDKIENIGLYKVIYHEIDKLIDVLVDQSLDSISEKVIDNNITLIPINSESVTAEFNGKILEAHKRLMDIHITVEGYDVIAYADVDSEVEEYLQYNEADDYALFTSDLIKKIVVPKGYFCIIPNNFAHMALYDGHVNVKKIVVKLQAGL
ncbi:YhcH/YjgK/YiaL family protein [Flavobacterium sp. Fl-318]|uniref:YhcH/YjgK/YiaL family protein n=1 Tax=Flavobacterium cupriresistens TaxID=2893885 RepID=A0ABU4RHV7_9FLAO|nr:MULTISPECIES: YhcH/YjgK/YiaL family protein [unclassified Flavobacterium]MDX6190126.1 YhcH/YjgK/YiaL family protein [Flavobacterium sp. Fl-318]UFH42947.1 YhcH/YjgK/YiaL family protein [Flavobacterium sp. F-323]